MSNLEDLTWCPPVSFCCKWCNSIHFNNWIIFHYIYMLHFPPFLFYFILSLLHLLTCVYIIWVTPPPPTPVRTCSALLFSGFVEEKHKR
jgi:hypothetical protein